MKKAFVLINGESGAGKDTFVNMCQIYSTNKKPYIPVINIHRSDKAKLILRDMGWDGVRTPEVRKLLSDLVNFGEYTGYNEKRLFDSIDRLGGVIFYHSRNPKIVETVKERYWYQDSIQISSVLVVRDKNKASEEDIWGIKNYPYDVIIENNSSKLTLEQKAEKFMQEIWKTLEV